MVYAIIIYLVCGIVTMFMFAYYKPVIPEDTPPWMLFVLALWVALQFVVATIAWPYVAFKALTGSGNKPLW